MSTQPFGRRLRLLSALALSVTLASCQSMDLSRSDVRAGLIPSSKAPALALGSEVVGERMPSTIVVDADTGRLLFAEDADGLRHPASLTKLMTLYLLFEAVDGGRLGLDDGLAVSAYAAGRAPSKLGLRSGETIRVRDAMYGLAVKSANDVASVVAEALSGSDDAFALVMTRKARQLGMTRTNFANPSGLPDPDQISTARDMAILAMQIRKRFPRYASLYAMQGFDYGGRHYAATNKLLGRVPGVDGMKTGYIGASGFNLVATARRNGRGVIVVVIGGRTGRERDARVEELIDAYLGPAA